MAIMRLGLNSLRIFSADCWQSLWTCRRGRSSALRLSQFQSPTGGVTGARAKLERAELLGRHRSLFPLPAAEGSHNTVRREAAGNGHAAAAALRQALFVHTAQFAMTHYARGGCRRKGPGSRLTSL